MITTDPVTVDECVERLSTLSVGIKHRSHRQVMPRRSTEVVMEKLTARVKTMEFLHDQTEMEGTDLDDLAFGICIVDSCHTAKRFWKLLSTEAPARAVDALMLASVASRGNGDRTSDREVKQIASALPSSSIIRPIFDVSSALISVTLPSQLYPHTQERPLYRICPIASKSVHRRIQQAMEWATIPYLSSPSMLREWAGVATAMMAGGYVTMPREVAEKAGGQSRAFVVVHRPWDFMEMTVMEYVRAGMTPQLAIEMVKR